LKEKNREASTASEDTPTKTNKQKLVVKNKMKKKIPGSISLDTIVQLVEKIKTVDMPSTHRHTSKENNLWTSVGTNKRNADSLHTHIMQARYDNQLIHRPCHLVISLAATSTISRTQA
jgi:tetrahydromethanopterin S-methyltransferase subunit F